MLTALSPLSSAEPMMKPATASESPESATLTTAVDANAALSKGHVTGRLDRHYVVSTSRGECRALRAFSCVIRPEVGDTVLLAGDEAQTHLLAVLSRPSVDVATLDVEGDLRVAPTGRVDIEAEQGVGIRTDELRLAARAGKVSVEAMHYAGGAVEAVLGTVRTVASTSETLVDRLTQKAKRIFRFADETEHVRAGSLDYTAEQTASVQGRNMVLTAEELVKVDGGQIHLG